MVFSQTRCIFANASISFVQFIACNVKNFPEKCNLEQSTVLFVVAVFFSYIIASRRVFLFRNLTLSKALSPSSFSLPNLLIKFDHFTS